MNAKNLVTFGGIGLLIGAALPWATVVSIFGTFSLNGLEGDGMISGGVGLIMLIVGAVSKPQPGKSFSVLGGFVFLFAGYIVVNTMVNISSVAEADPTGIAQIGSGIYISLVSVLIGVVGAFTKEPEEIPEPESQT